MTAWDRLLVERDWLAAKLEAAHVKVASSGVDFEAGRAHVVYEDPDGAVWEVAIRPLERDRGLV